MAPFFIGPFNRLHMFLDRINRLSFSGPLWASRMVVCREFVEDGGSLGNLKMSITNTSLLPQIRSPVEPCRLQVRQPFLVCCSANITALEKAEARDSDTDTRDEQTEAAAPDQPDRVWMCGESHVQRSGRFIGNA